MARRVHLHLVSRHLGRLPKGRGVTPARLDQSWTRPLPSSFLIAAFALPAEGTAVSILVRMARATAREKVRRVPARKAALAAGSFRIAVRGGARNTPEVGTP
jgi:hypothetical protein